jgi:hypothetical protein
MIQASNEPAQKSPAGSSAGALAEAVLIQFALVEAVNS